MRVRLCGGRLILEAIIPTRVEARFTVMPVAGWEHPTDFGFVLERVDIQRLLIFDQTLREWQVRYAGREGPPVGFDRDLTDLPDLVDPPSSPKGTE